MSTSSGYILIKDGRTDDGRRRKRDGLDGTDGHIKDDDNGTHDGTDDGTDDGMFV